MTNDEAEAMLAELSKHYGTPVMPISRYCEALRTWQDALSERVSRLKEELYPGFCGDNKDPKTVEACELYIAEKKIPNLYTLARAENRQLTPRENGIENLREFENRSQYVDDVFRQISKSNLLARLLYAGEKIRAEMCPIHKGVWSGIEWGDTVCPHKCQLTGWIQDGVDQGKPLPGVVAVKLVPNSEGKPGDVTMIRSVDGEVLGQAVVPVK